jgi:hypothetical protein
MEELEEFVCVGADAGGWVTRAREERRGDMARMAQFGKYYKIIADCGVSDRSLNDIVIAQSTSCRGRDGNCSTVAALQSLVGKGVFR